jgi:dolichol-phosphate mannosyltransferase
LQPVDLTMVVPTYNERHRLAELVTALFDAATNARLALELVVVDDNSPDGTGALADDLSRTCRMRVIHRPRKLGLGTAVVEGFAAATSDVVGVMDADFSHPPASVPPMFAAFRETRADMLVASRYIPGGSTSNWPFVRRMLSRLACSLAKPLSPMHDSTSGFFLIRRSVASAATIQAGGFKIALELLVRARPQAIVEFPFRFNDREQGESKMSMREAVGYLRQLRDLYLWTVRHPRTTRQHYQRLSPADVQRVTGVAS